MRCVTAIVQALCLAVLCARQLRVLAEPFCSSYAYAESAVYGSTCKQGWPLGQRETLRLY